MVATEVPVEDTQLVGTPRAPSHPVRRSRRSVASGRAIWREVPSSDARGAPNAGSRGWPAKREETIGAPGPRPRAVGRRRPRPPERHVGALKSANAGCRATSPFLLIGPVGS